MDKVIKLKEPIKYGSETISELTIRKPKAKDLRKLSGNNSVSEILDLAGRLCGQPPSVMDELGMDDTMAILEIVGNFMEPGPTTGEVV